MTRIARGVMLGCLGTPDPALAHSPIPGIDGFYLGLLHPLSTPAQALSLIGLGLLIAGLRQDHHRAAVAVFVAGTLASLVAGARVEDPETALFFVAVATCGLAALWPGPPRPVGLAAIALGGLLIGQASVPEAGPTRDRVITMAGSFVGANAAIFYVAGAAIYIRDRFRRQWIGVALRILSAWLAAVALLMLALGIATGEAPA